MRRGREQWVSSVTAFTARSNQRRCVSRAADFPRGVSRETAFPRPRVSSVALAMALVSVVIMLAYGGQPARRQRLCRRVDVDAARARPRSAGARVSSSPWPRSRRPCWPRTGWTVTADSQELTGRETARRATCSTGTRGRLWHTKYIGGTDPLPHTLTIDMKAVLTVAGLNYLPRSAASGVKRPDRPVPGSTSRSTARPWGVPAATGTFADDATEKTSVFASTSAPVRAG